MQVACIQATISITGNKFHVAPVCRLQLTVHSLSRCTITVPLNSCVEVVYLFAHICTFETKVWRELTWDNNRLTLLKCKLN